MINKDFKYEVRKRKKELLRIIWKQIIFFNMFKHIY